MQKSVEQERRAEGPKGRKAWNKIDRIRGADTSLDSLTASQMEDVMFIWQIPAPGVEQNGRDYAVGKWPNRWAGDLLPEE